MYLLRCYTYRIKNTFCNLKITGTFVLYLVVGCSEYLQARLLELGRYKYPSTRENGPTRSATTLLFMLPIQLFILFAASLTRPANSFRVVPSVNQRFALSSENIHRRSDTSSGRNYNPNGSAFLWLPQDTYAGETFFK